MILGFDTATPATVVALWGAGGEPALEARDDPPLGARPRHATRLLALIEELLAQTGADWERVERIGVGVGPGTFTGLRIGVATARGLSQARGIPLVGVSTLRSLASAAAAPPSGGSAPPRPDEPVLALVDARRGEVFAGAWRTAELGQSDPAPLLAPAALGPAVLGETVRRLGGPALLAIGPGAVESRAVLESSGARVPGDESELHRVSALIHCRIASTKRLGDPADVRPAYLRLPDAEITRRRP